MRRLPTAAIVLIFISRLVNADDIPKTLEAARAATCKPFTGPTTHGVDTTTLTNKLVCGYQGWFNTPDDGAGRGWVHWTKHRGDMADGNAKVDLWPDMSELTPAERFATGFKLPDGKPADVFSSFNRLTVLRHFNCMREYGIDAVFVQRFAGGVRDPRFVYHNNTVLAHCREGANLNGRGYVVMYDLSGMGPDQMDRVMDDWCSLKLRMKITDDPAYLRNHGQPLVAVEGLVLAMTANTRLTIAGSWWSSSRTTQKPAGARSCLACQPTGGS